MARVAFEQPNYNARQQAGRLRTVRAGFAHHRAGRLQRAESLYRKALQRNPDDANALHLLGVVAYQNGEAGTALSLIERALPELPKVADAHLNYGNALRAVGRLAEAIASYRRALALDPDYGMGHNNLAAALNEQEEFAAGLASAERAIAFIPEYFGAYVNRAVALMGLARFGEAEATLRRALALEPDQVRTRCDLGWALARLGRQDEAITCLEQAAALYPDDATPLFGLGATLCLRMDLVGSEAALRRALALAPDYAAAWHELGTVLRSSGRFEEALACFQRALELDQDWPEVYRSLAVTGWGEPKEVHLSRLEAVLDNSERAISERISAGFALGTLLDEAGRYDEAFACFADANALYRRQRAEGGERFEISALQCEVDDLIELSTPAFFSAVASWGNPAETPVFIVGMPRSGTTLVEQIAASHSRVFGAGELRGLASICNTLSVHNGGLLPIGWEPSLVRQLADRHLAHLQALGNGADRVIDKMPDNIFLLWLVAALFPKARVILCRRDVRDVCLSCYFQHFTEGHLYAYDLSDCAARAMQVDRLAAHWLQVLPLDILIVNYEALLAEPERESRRLIEFLGLDWEPACLEFHRTQRPVLTASAWQIRQPLYRHSAGRWQRYARNIGPMLQVLSENVTAVQGAKAGAPLQSFTTVPALCR